jgi:NADH-quinone oxidoreductase subunit M
VVGLFFIAEILFRRLGTHEITQMGGITKNAKYFSICFIIIMLGSVALPLTNGFVGEFLLLKGVYEYNVLAAAIAGLTIIFGAIYMLRLVQKSILGPEKSFTETFSELTFTEKATLLPLVAMVILFGIAPNLLLNITEPAVNQLLTIINFSPFNIRYFKPIFRLSQ